MAHAAPLNLVSRRINDAISAQTAELLETMESRCQREDTGHGFMEFFDWLASTSDSELIALMREHKITVDPACSQVPLTSPQRETLGLAVWSRL